LSNPFAQRHRDDPLEVGEIEWLIDIGESAELEGLTRKHGVGIPLTMITLVVGLIERIRLSSSMPFIPGSAMSSKTSSGRDRMASFKPSSLVSAPKTL
jgi:hypothetical protein